MGTTDHTENAAVVDFERYSVLILNHCGIKKGYVLAYCKPAAY